jgi:predicted nucleic-acid-binding protein
MIALDTNVLARFYISETDPGAARQHKTATGLMEQPALFVARTVVLELEWVLRGGYGYAREDVARVLDHLLGLPNVAVENREIVEDALNHYHEGLDFADALHLAAAKSAQAFATFDSRFAKRAERLGLQPVVIPPSKAV